MALIAKPAAEGYLCKAQFTMLQQQFGSLNPLLQDVLIGCHSHLLFEQTQKVIRTDLGDRSNLN